MQSSSYSLKTPSTVQFKITFFKFVSLVFHPLFVPTMVFAFFVYLSPSLFFGITEKTYSWWLIVLAYSTITFPLLTVFLLWRLKFIESMQMHGTKERYGPLISSMLFYFWVFWLFHKQFNAPLLIQSFLFGVFLTSVCVFMATIFFKISMHSAAWGGVICIAMLSAFQHIDYAVFALVVVIGIAGLVGSARLFLQAHTPKQLYSGYIVGFLAQGLAYFVLSLLLK